MAHINNTCRIFRLNPQIIHRPQHFNPRMNTQYPIISSSRWLRSSISSPSFDGDITYLCIQMTPSICSRSIFSSRSYGEDISFALINLLFESAIAEKQKKQYLPIASIFTSQPRALVVSTNQSRACLSASESARRDIPRSVAFLSGCQYESLCIRKTIFEKQFWFYGKDTSTALRSLLLTSRLTCS